MILYQPEPPGPFMEQKDKSSGNSHVQPKKNAQTTFLKKIKKGEKLLAQRGHLLAIRWCDVRDVYILTSAHNDVMEEMPTSRGTH